MTEAACDRCGITRTVHNGDNRSNFCRDRKAGYSDQHVNRDWMVDAACTQVDPELFFPERADLWEPTRQAKQVCASCPVRALCAADTPAWDRWSVRAGMTATERRRAAA